MPNTDLKSQIKNLVQLQKVDSQIHDLKYEKSQLPQEIEAITASFEAKKQSLAELEKETLDLEVKKKEGEVDLAAKEEQAKKFQGQLYSLKTNEEYKAMLQQIEGVNADASVVEDKILELLEKIEESKKAIVKERERLKEEEKLSGQEKAKIEVRIKEIDGQLAQLDAQRKQFSPGVDANILKQYERILANRDALAIVDIQDNACHGCNMSVPPQVINLIRMYERIVTCEVCNRILYIKDEEA
ncbi:zinc ribbon domain-containing protein [Candidatus Omnitrophota bacterium]